MTSKTPTDTISIRQAVAEDADELAALATGLGYPSSAKQILERLNRIVLDEEQAVMVAELQGGELAGFAYVFTAKCLVSDPYAELDVLIVDEKKRGLGIGAELVQGTERWGLERGLGLMRIRSNILRMGAKGFYLHIGYDLNKTQNVFLKRLK